MNMFKNTYFYYIIATLVFVQICHAQNLPQDYVDAHNLARAAVGVGNITWNETLATYARLYANHRMGDCANRSSNGPYGENIAIGNGPFMTGIHAVNLWISNADYYDYTSNTCSNTLCLTYTQVVWRDSIHVGCARVACVNGRYFVVCSYSPRGNIIGQRPF